MKSGVGLLAHDNVRWLILSEPDVKRAIEGFIRGNSEPFIDVAGPPTYSDLLKHKENPGSAIVLPCVRLNLRMFQHHLTFQRGVEVTCSDTELQEIARWRLASSFGKPKH